MPVNTGPSFMSRLGGQMPGMLNALGQNYGGDLSGAAKASSGLLAKQKAPKFRTPKVTTGMGNQQLPGQQMPMPQMPGEMNAQMPMGINTAPSPQLFQNPYANIFGGGTPGYGRTGNTGVAGGLFNRPPGYERPDMGSTGANLGGMFGTFNRLSQPGQTPFGYRF